MKVINLVLVIVLGALQYRLWSGPGSIPDVRRLNDIRTEQVRENRELRERNLALAAEVLDLKHGLEAVEERARSEMGMIMSGETFYQIIGADTAAGR
ncbi:MAG: cell division protein FtsB [Gammaproteobacteria bacterium]|nr:cell division protein FtsB [Gammaproteobacteria bacterium]